MGKPQAKRNTAPRRGAKNRLCSCKEPVLQNSGYCRNCGHAIPIDRQCSAKPPEKASDPKPARERPTLTPEQKEAAKKARESRRLLELRASPNFVGECTIDEFRLFYCAGATEDSLVRCFLKMKHTFLNPHHGALWFKLVGYDIELDQMLNEQKRAVYEPVVTILGMRTLAADLADGDGEPAWCGEDGKWQTSWPPGKAPVAARVQVFAKGRGPSWGIALYAELAPDFYYEGGKRIEGTPRHWLQRPASQLLKCAYADGHRKAFPVTLGDSYCPEEMEHVGAQTSRPDVLSVARAARGTRPGGLLLMGPNHGKTQARRVAEEIHLATGGGQLAPDITHAWADEAHDMIESGSMAEVAQAFASGAVAMPPSSLASWRKDVDTGPRAIPILETEAGRQFAGQVMALFPGFEEQRGFMNRENIVRMTDLTAQEVDALIPWLEFLSVGRALGLTDPQTEQLAAWWGFGQPHSEASNPTALRARTKEALAFSPPQLAETLKRAGIK